MKQKIVSFKVAKAIKKAGYPQDYKNTKDTYTNLNGGIWVKPIYLDVWIWLWREKGIEILTTGDIIVKGKGKLETKTSIITQMILKKPLLVQ